MIDSDYYREYAILEDNVNPEQVDDPDEREPFFDREREREREYVVYELADWIAWLLAVAVMAVGLFNTLPWAKY